MNILLTLARIGQVEVPNRIVLPPMTTRAADAEGFVTDDTLASYQARVAGGVGLTPMAPRAADPEGFVTEYTLAYYQARVAGVVGLITVEMASPEKAGRH